LIEEHYPGVLLGTNALKYFITIKYKYMHTCIKYGNAIIDVDSRGEVNHICLHGASMFSRLKR